MAIKNLFGRGVGFGPVHWIVTRGYDSSTVVVSPQAPSPHRLSADLVTTRLASSGLVGSLLLYPSAPSALGVLGDDGVPMSTPLLFTAGETGPITLTCTGADGTAEDLSTASSVTLRVKSVTGTVVVNAVALTSPTSAGTAIWTRLSAQVATAGDYAMQVKVIRADATIGLFPDAQSGMPLTMLPAV